IDHFKRINDEFGHQAGDQVLARLAGLLTSHCRSSDIICRYGGEEFVVLMPEVTIGAAVERADAIRLAFTGLKMRFNNRDLAPTLSVGIAACPLHATSGDRLFECADQALYRAKAAGRNRTVLWSDCGLQPWPDTGPDRHIQTACLRKLHAGDRRQYPRRAWGPDPDCRTSFSAR